MKAKKAKLSDVNLEKASGGIKVPGFMKKGAKKLMSKGKDYWEENQESIISEAKGLGKKAMERFNK